VSLVSLCISAVTIAVGDGTRAVACIECRGRRCDVHRRGALRCAALRTDVRDGRLRCGSARLLCTLVDVLLLFAGAEAVPEPAQHHEGDDGDGDEDEKVEVTFQDGSTCTFDKGVPMRQIWHEYAD